MPTVSPDLSSRSIIAAAIMMGWAAVVVCPLQATEPVQVQIETSLGDIQIELYPDRAPKTVENFLAYVKNGHYEGTVFHRVIQDFVIQAGGRQRDLRVKDTLPPIPIESDNGLSNDEYTVAMSRKPDPDSATSQFFVNTAGDNQSLNRDQCPDGYGYTVFGKVVSGMDVVDQIESVPTRSVADPDFPAIALGNVPVEPILILKASMVEGAVVAVDEEEESKGNVDEDADKKSLSETPKAAPQAASGETTNDEAAQADSDPREGEE